MNAPLIGVTTYGQDEKNTFYLPVEYVEAVRRAGGIPVLLPPGEPHWNVLLETLDGLVLAGGGDLDPARYGGANHESIYMVDQSRDESEIALARQVMVSGLPTLGICRGTQVINVALGGTLIEHLPDVVGETIAHRLPKRLHTEHAVLVKPRSRLAAVLSELQFSSVSWHHQAIRQLAPSLQVVARAPDGTIEAVEMADHPWLIAVQWHPELTAATDPVQQRLFDGLVKTASDLRQNRSNPDKAKSKQGGRQPHDGDGRCA